MSAPHADGIYLDLPLADYLADDALSGSAFDTLLTEPESLRWERESNPYYIKPERTASRRPQLRGSASHCAVLEGTDVYAQRYKVKPEGVLSTDDDLKTFLRNAKAAWLDKLTEANGGVKPKLKREDSAPFLQTGEREDLEGRVRALDPKAQIWDPDADDILLPADDLYVRCVSDFVRETEDFAKYVTGGFAEVSIFWTEGEGDEAVRFKCRVDYLTWHTVLDMKTYSQPPKRGMSLRKHCVRLSRYNSADLQAVHNTRGVTIAGGAFLADQMGVICVGLEDAAVRIQRINKLREIFEAHQRDAPTFRWLYLRMAGAPAGIVIPFRRESEEWATCEDDTDSAVAVFKDYRAKCGDGQWRTNAGEQEIGPYDWPNREVEIPA